MRADSPSSTAIVIAATTVFLARDRVVSDLVPEGAARWCARCLEAISPWRLKAVRTLSHPVLRWGPRFAEWVTIPGLLLHLMLRKRRIEEAVRAALADGFEQVVVVGAGFDTLALRLGKDFPNIRFIEIDYPSTQRFKRLAVERDGAPPNLEFIAADLTHMSLQETLSTGVAYRADVRSVFVMEGLLMYLTEQEVAGVFTALRQIQRAPARVVFSVIESMHGGRPAFSNETLLVRWLLSRWGEPFKSALSAREAGVFLDRFGYQLSEVVSTETLRRRYLMPSGREHLPLAEGEVIMVADAKHA